MEELEPVDSRLTAETLLSDEKSPAELYRMLVPAALAVPWTDTENPVRLNMYLIKLLPIPNDRTYAEFGLFVKPLFHKEVERMHRELHLGRGRMVEVDLVPSGCIEFDKDEITHAQNFQELWLTVMYDRELLLSDSFTLGRRCSTHQTSTFYLLLPVKMHDEGNNMVVDWSSVKGYLFSPIFKAPVDDGIDESAVDVACDSGVLNFANGTFHISDVLNSLVVTLHNKLMYCVVDILYDLNGYSILGRGKGTYIEYFKGRNVELLQPEQPLVKAKHVSELKNLLLQEQRTVSGKQEKVECFVELPPEICSVKLFRFSKEIASTIFLLPFVIHFLENLLVAAELQDLFSASFRKGSEVSASRILEALTTARCMECFSLERLEILGDVFLKYVVSRHLFLLDGSLDEGQLTRRRASIISNQNLYELAVKRNLQVYIRNMQFDRCCFFALGRPCTLICNKNTQKSIHFLARHGQGDCNGTESDVRCSEHHQWLHRKTIADVIEALIGAFIVDSGFLAAQEFMQWIGIQVGVNRCDVYKICDMSQRNLSLLHLIDIDEVERKLGYKFEHTGIIVEAFVHPSYRNHCGSCYQRLEFLGDAVLDYVITSYLYSAYPGMAPGVLTDWRSASVNNNTFAHLALSLSLQSHLICDSASLSEAVFKFEKYVQLSSKKTDLYLESKGPKVLGDLVESYIGAVAVDSGFNMALVWRIFFGYIYSAINFSCLPLQPVRELRELCDINKFVLSFPSPELNGSDFLVEVTVVMEGTHLTSRAVHPNKKAAICMASQDLLSKLETKGCRHNTKLLRKTEKSDCKLEPKLIGYDEVPKIARMALLIGQQHLQDSGSAEKSKHVRQGSPNPSMATLSSQNLKKSCSFIGERVSGLPYVITAKMLLSQLCTAKCWKQPCFMFLGEVGPCHLKLSKVTVEVDVGVVTVLECFSEPRPKKKSAEQHAAMGALWCLRHLGH